MSPKKILFLHPDLGIGGAERLVVDAALALKNSGHTVQFITTHHDPSHCFAETKDGLLPVRVVGDWIPRNLFGRFTALCAYIRMIYAACYIVLFSEFHANVIFCDIVSACIPVLRLLKIPIVFYCHFPDQLLSVRGSRLKDLYRVPINWIEEKSTSFADVILVNSQFTCNIFKETFTTIKKTPQILYPSINTDSFHEEISITLDSILGKKLGADKFIFLSINRYERKKNISLAITAMNTLKDKLSDDEWAKVTLIIAGGFDLRVHENIDHFKELSELSKKLELSDKVHFLKSPSDNEKIILLRTCDCLLYTPSNEHFGIVPLEAMYSKKPVIAVNSGGPLETVVNKETGFLSSPTEEDFSSAMSQCVKNNDLIDKMGYAGKRRFEERFSFGAFSKQLNTVIEAFSADSVKGKKE